MRPPVWRWTKLGTNIWELTDELIIYLYGTTFFTNVCWRSHGMSTGSELTLKCKIAKILKSEASFPAAVGEMFFSFCDLFSPNRDLNLPKKRLLM